jgi:hypothetical protein
VSQAERLVSRATLLGAEEGSGSSAVDGHRFRIYSSQRFLRAGKHYVVALYPFWGKPTRSDELGPWPDFADEYIEKASDYLELASIDQADAALFPWNWKSAAKYPEGLGLAQEFAETARSHGVPPVFFMVGDSVDPVPVEDAFVFRTSGHRSRREPREFALPGFHEDLLRYNGGALEPRQKTSRATVSFCGMVVEEDPSAGTAGRARRLVGQAKSKAQELKGKPSSRDVFVRARAVRALQDQAEVETNFVIRETGGGGALYPALKRPLWEQVRREYVANIADGDYVLCARGAGNWSWRLYETLSMGRIPVLVDTDCLLPYDFLVEWRDFCVWVDRSEIDSIGEKVATFHDRLSPTDFVELQRGCRRLWERFLSPLGFFANFHRHFETNRLGEEAS